MQLTKIARKKENEETIKSFEIDDLFEEKILLNVIHYQSFLDTVGEFLKPEYFTNEYFKFIASHVLEYYSVYSKPITQTTLILYLKKKYKGLEKEEEAFINKISIYAVKFFDDTYCKPLLRDKENVQEYAEEFIKLQEVQIAILQGATDIQNRKFDSLVSRLERALTVGISKNIGIDLDDIEDRKENKPRKNIMPLPWDAVNKRIGGGMGDGEFFTLVAPMGTGKSMWANTLLAHSKKIGVNSVLYSLEMDEAYNRQRIDAILLDKPLDEIGQVTEEYLDLIRAKIENYNKAKCYIKNFEGQTVTANTIKNHLKILRNRGVEVDLIIVDYIDLMDTVDEYSRHKKEWEKFETISRELVSLAMQEKIKIFALLQGNTSSMDQKIITAKNTSGGAKRLHPAHVIFGYARPDEYKVEDRAVLSFIKNRFGKDGFALDVKTDYSRAKIDIQDVEITTVEEEYVSEKKTKEMLKEHWLLNKHKKKKIADTQEEDIYSF
jgi:replicative DNA helicase